MPTVIAHAAVGWTLVNGLGATAPVAIRRRCAKAAAILAIAPDIDVYAFRFGIPYEAPLGHRGLTHSLAFAAVTATVAWLICRRCERVPNTLVAALVLAAVSHPLLDMMTDGGLGCALWAPLSNARLFLPWTPIPVSPIGITRGLWHVLAFEACVFLPPLVLSLLIVRKLRPAPTE
jgi:inner membrane protein